jgi:hypothetical protein
MRAIVFFIAVLVLAAPVSLAQTDACTPFYNQAEFEAFNQAEGKTLQGIETFEESNISDGGKQFLPAPLNQDPNTFFGIGFPKGLLQNIAIWDNITPGPNPPDLNPSGTIFALYVIGPNFLGSTSKKAGSDLLLGGTPGSLDLVFPVASYSGVGFELSWFFLQGSWNVSVYNTQGQTIGQYQFAGAPGPEPQTSFFGIWCDEPTGRINVFYDQDDFPAVDNIQMWQ